MRLSLILALQSVNSYGMNQCRDFRPDQLVEDFEFKHFLGEWYPMYESVLSAYVTGRCPIYQFLTVKPTNRHRKLEHTYDYFDWKQSYKGMLGMVDNEKRF